jgi:lipoprotein-anchoring transpeptidase ErfK/SrfK
MRVPRPPRRARAPYPKQNANGFLGVTLSVALLTGLPSSAHAMAPDLHQYLQSASDAARRSRGVQPAAKLSDVVPSAKEKSFGNGPAKDLSAKNLAAKNPAAKDLAANAPGILTLVISLSKQRLTLYSDGQRVTGSSVSTGQPGHSTPAGVFSIIQKDRWHHSNIYDSAPMYFMQRITWSGVALHQGVVPNYPASHGCVRLPEAFARQLWGTTKLGVRVIIARDDPAPVAISHPLLFTHPTDPPVAKRDGFVTPAQVAQAAFGAAVSLGRTNTASAMFAEHVIALSGGTPISDSLFEMSEPNPATFFAPSTPATAPLKPGPISVLISRKQGHLYVRKGFEPVFSAPITFERPTEAVGTHVFTALAPKGDNDSLRWIVTTAKASGPSLTAAAALDRVTIPAETAEKISGLMSAGASLIVTDEGLGSETGVGTDFIVLTH